MLQSGAVVKLLNLLSVCSAGVNVVAGKELYELELGGCHCNLSENSQVSQLLHDFENVDFLL